MRKVLLFLVALTAPATYAYHCTETDRAVMIADVTANPGAIERYYALCRVQFLEDLGPAFGGLNEDGRKLAFASVIASNLKPYGASMAFTLNDALSASVLDCDNYVFLTWHLFVLLDPTTTVKFHMVGWNGGAVGNHAQIFAERTGVPIILDPTVGIVGVATFDQVASGKPVVTLRSFPSRAAPESFRDLVVSSLEAGRYKPSDLLYWFDDVWRYVSTLDSIANWATPQAAKVASPRGDARLKTERPARRDD